jgi:hypothetical protein
MKWMKSPDLIGRLDERSVAGTGESSCGSDSGSSVLVLVVEVSVGTSLGDSLGFEGDVVTLVQVSSITSFVDNDLRRPR